MRKGEERASSSREGDGKQSGSKMARTTARRKHRFQLPKENASGVLVESARRGSMNRGPGQSRLSLSRCCRASPAQPWTLRRKREIILPVNAHPKSNIRPLRNEERVKLLHAIATARGWCDALLPAPQQTVEAIASDHGKTERWVRKHLTLAFLDPRLVEAAVDGALPRGYGLSRFIDLPADWNDQW